ncbi:hypothetical protein, partial [Stutzerimonas frequens]|uniref:hypothetical protein n=1 Tax=Stutzerimonas frequens TaxID=2968969 RepID=UPI00210D28E4
GGGGGGAVPSAKIYRTPIPIKDCSSQAAQDLDNQLRNRVLIGMASFMVLDDSYLKNNLLFIWL